MPKFDAENPTTGRARSAEPLRQGLFNRPRLPPAGNFRSFLQGLGTNAGRPRRDFGGWRNAIRCERAAPDLFFLICDGDPLDTADLAERILEGAERFGYDIQVDQIERRAVTGRDVFAIREVSGRTLGYEAS